MIKVVIVAECDEFEICFFDGSCSSFNMVVCVFRQELIKVVLFLVFCGTGKVAQKSLIDAASSGVLTLFMY